MQQGADVAPAAAAAGDGGGDHPGGPAGILLRAGEPGLGREAVPAAPQQEPALAPVRHLLICAQTGKVTHCPVLLHQYIVKS